MPNSAGSIPELPVSPGARAARIGLVLLIDVVMMGVGVYLIHSYLERRGQGRDGGEVVDVYEPTPAGSAVVAAGHDAPPVPGAIAATTVAKPPRVEASPPPARRARPAARHRSRPSTPPAARPHPSEADPAPATDGSGTRRADAPEPGAEVGVGGASAEDGPPAGGGNEPGDEASEGDSSAGGVTDDMASSPAPDEEVQKLAARVARVVDSNQVILRRCYERAAKGPGAAEPLQGRIDVRLTVQGDGNAANVRVESNNTGSDVLAACLVAAVGSWSFPQHPYQPVEFIWPFAFHPPQDE